MADPEWWSEAIRRAVANPDTWPEELRRLEADPAWVKRQEERQRQKEIRQAGEQYARQRFGKYVHLRLYWALARILNDENWFAGPEPEIAARIAQLQPKQFFAQHCGKPAVQRVAEWLATFGLAFDERCPTCGHSKTKQIK